MNPEHHRDIQRGLTQAYLCALRAAQRERNLAVAPPRTVQCEQYRPENEAALTAVRHTNEPLDARPTVDCGVTSNAVS